MKFAYVFGSISYSVATHNTHSICCNVAHSNVSKVVLTKKRKTSYEFREVLTLRQTRTRALGMPDLYPFGMVLYHSQTGKVLMQLSSRDRDEQGDLMQTINMLEVQVDFEVNKGAEVLDELVGSCTDHL